MKEEYYHKAPAHYSVGYLDGYRAGVEAMRDEAIAVTTVFAGKGFVSVKGLSMVAARLLMDFIWTCPGCGTQHHAAQTDHCPCEKEAQG